MLNLTNFLEKSLLILVRIEGFISFLNLSDSYKLEKEWPHLVHCLTLKG